MITVIGRNKVSPTKGTTHADHQPGVLVQVHKKDGAMTEEILTGLEKTGEATTQLTKGNTATPTKDSVHNPGHSTTPTLRKHNPFLRPTRPKRAPQTREYHRS